MALAETVIGDVLLHVGQYVSVVFVSYERPKRYVSNRGCLPCWSRPASQLPAPAWILVGRRKQDVFRPETIAL